MRIIKPLRIGCMTKIAQLEGKKRYEVTVTGMLCWDLNQPESLYTDSVMWESITKQFGSRCVLDNWQGKQRGEFLVWGQAFAPGGQPVERMQVTASVGGQRKTLEVIGDRYWRPSVMRTHSTAIQPFTTMPLEYSRAYGGADYPANPLGLGHRADERIDAGEEQVQLPNLEDPKNPILHQRDQRVPNVFAPVDLTWPAQLQRRGTFDQSWLKKRYPRMPIDLDPDMYNVAPADQRLSGGYFRGDEAVSIRGMNAEHSLIESRLPGLQLRVFVMPEGKEQTLKEYPTVIDTVWLLPGELKGVLLYRSVVPCADPDMRDIESIMFACDRANYPRPIEHYQETHRLRTDEKTKALYLLADDQLMPELLPEVLKRLEQRRDEVRKEREEKWRLKTEHFSAMAVAAGGAAMPASMAQAFVKNAMKADQMPIVLPEDIARGNVDYVGIQRAADSMRQQAEDMRSAGIALIPPKIRSEAYPDEKPGKTFTPEQIVQVLGLEEAQAKSAQLAQEMTDLADKLEADPSLSPHQELANWSQARADQAKAEFVGGMGNKEMASFMQAVESLNKDSAARAEPAQPAGGDPAGMRERMIAGIRDMATNAAKGVFGVPDVDPLAVRDGTLKALGVQNTADFAQWPPGKVGVLMKQALAQAAEKDGLLGVVEFAGQLQQTTLASLPAAERAPMQELFDAQMSRSRSTALAYKEACPEGEKKIIQAFMHPENPQSPPDDQTYGSDDPLNTLRKVVAEDKDPVMRARALGLLDQSEKMMGDMMSKSMPEFVTDGQVDFKKYQASTAAMAGLLANFKLPTADGLVESDWLTYDKRYVRAIAQGIIGRMGLPLAPAPEDAEQITVAGSMAQRTFESMQDAENGMRDARRRSLIRVPGLGLYPAEVAAYLGQWVVQAHKQGLCLAGRDMAGADLRGVDLRGADLSGALLDGADLSDAKLDNVKAEGVVLSGAQLQRSSWRGANLRRANLGQAQAQQAVFAGADLSEAKLFEANLSQADCSEARLDGVEGINTVAHGLQASGSRCSHAKFINADLSDFNLQQAHWDNVVFMQGSMLRLNAAQAELTKCAWVNLDLSGSNFQQAQLREANFVHCTANALQADGVQVVQMTWTKSMLDAAQFNQASLERALFEDCQLARAGFHTSNLPGAFFMRCVLTQACFTQAQLMGANFHNAKLSDASLRHANLHNADFSEAALDRADLTGSRRLGGLLEMPRESVTA